MKFIPISEASYYLDASRNNMMVTAHQFKKRNGDLPVWYKTIDKKVCIDIEHIQAIREREENIHREATDLYYFIVEDMGIIQSKLADRLAVESEVYTKRNSWMSFLQTSLFGSPFAKFHDRVTRLQEFYRICKIIKDEHDTNRR